MLLEMLPTASAHVATTTRALRSPMLLRVRQSKAMISRALGIHFATRSGISDVTAPINRFASLMPIAAGTVIATVAMWAKTILVGSFKMHRHAVGRSINVTGRHHAAKTPVLRARPALKHVMRRMLV